MNRYALHQANFSYVVNSGTCVFRQYFLGILSSAFTTTLTGTGNYETPVVTSIDATNFAQLRWYFNGTNVFQMDMTAAEVDHITDVPATGLRLVSATGGATRNMVHAHADFNANDIRKVNIHEVV